ncbi:9957_t:CDS:2 [Funneliformis geosporum]|uniref:8870_t:CDS:1 n=1 Tax=Funneliformis geosporum TaxID=1117311 RepID=A0A9W4T6R0_9GLOM|nr:9957_t:CDS:2 [Funneliformis geosporum]CAI2193869.1 8870_t:CDS:2 [Funneliformis geosporum]
MKLSAVIFLIVALLASIAFSVPTEYNKDDDFITYCKDIEFKKPVDGIIYKINSTQVADFVLPEECIKRFGYQMRTTVEIFSVAGNKVVDTIVEFEDIYNRPAVFLYLIDKVWANDGATYFLIATLFNKDYKVQGQSGKFTTVDDKEQTYNY